MRVVIACGLLAGCVYTPPSPASPDVDASATLPPDADTVVPFTVRVEAAIDGRSRILVRESSLHWTHHEFAAPGRLDFEDDPTRIDGIDWFPTWPDVPDRENRDCNCPSSEFTNLAGRIPRAPIGVTVTTVMGREDATVLELPSDANNFTLAIEIDDGVAGSDNYVIDIDVGPP